ncbi:MAG: hypothetical protein ABI689_11715 [Thermoanaerobaculia bacterium]
MASAKKSSWKRGRGKLGVLDPLLGSWEAETDSPRGPIRCRRRFSRILAGKRVLLEAAWHLPAGVYEEHAVYGLDDSGKLAFWSFTSDGKQSHGTLTAATDVHPEAIAFAAQMPAGLARMVYWPGDDGQLDWAVESKTNRGWNRFTIHHYRAAKDREP